MAETNGSTSAGPRGEDGAAKSVSALPKGPLKCVVIGNSQAGKSSLVEAASREDGEHAWPLFPEYHPVWLDEATSFKPRDLVNGTADLGVLEITDGPKGSCDYEEIRHRLLAGSDVAVLCLREEDAPTSLSDDDIIQEMGVWVVEMRQHCPDVPFVVALTQVDRRSGRSVDATDSAKIERRVREVREAGAAGYIECSALLNTGVRELFETAAAIAADRELETAAGKANRQRQDKAKCTVS